MEENNNRKGPGIFYAVVGVATLVVAIVGASFAYFSAVGTTSGSTITGTTNDISGANLSVSVQKIAYTGVTDATGKLVPADLNAATTAGINQALTAKCEKNGYTGCHVYRITASTTQTISNANLFLDMAVTANTKTNWKYVVFQGSENEATSITKAAANISKAAVTAETSDDVDIHSNAGLTQGTPAVYYLLVYLENTESAQNDGETAGTTSETGTYNGTVTLTAMGGGQVKASFTS